MKQFIFIISIAFASSQSSLITKKYKDEIKQLSEQDIVKKAFDLFSSLNGGAGISVIVMLFFKVNGSSSSI